MRSPKNPRTERAALRGVALGGALLAVQAACGRGGPSARRTDAPEQASAPAATEPASAEEAADAAAAAASELRQRCRELARKYERERSAIAACASDRDCRAEERGARSYELDGCWRFVRADASTEAADAVVEQWRAAGCGPEPAPCPPPPLAQCREGSCVERPPRHVPSSWVRHDVARSFSIFLPPDAELQDGQGEDSIVRSWKRPNGNSVSIDYGAHGGIDLEAMFWPITKATIDGRTAMLTEHRAILSREGWELTTFFPEVPCGRVTHWPFWCAEPPKLTVSAWCPARGACGDERRVGQTVHFW